MLILLGAADARSRGRDCARSLDRCGAAADDASLTLANAADDAARAFRSDVHSCAQPLSLLQLHRSGAQPCDQHQTQVFGSDDELGKQHLSLVVGLATLDTFCHRT